jgi:hypothetical protein
MRMTSEVETNIVAVERVREYSNTPQVLLTLLLQKFTVLSFLKIGSGLGER